MGVFSIRDKKVVLNTNVMLIPEMKAIIEAYPKDYINVLSYVNFMTNPNKDENPYLEVREIEKSSKLLRDFPAKYDENTPLVRAAIARMKEDFIDLPEDRMYEAAKIAAESVESYLRTSQINTLKDTETMMKILLNVEKVTESLGKTREARNAARSANSVRGSKKLAYDMER